MPPSAFAAHPLGSQQVLDCLERALVNQRLMPSFVGLPGIVDNAHVVRITEQAGQAVNAECPASHLAGSA
ncbi:MAG TPA: hypothetical protein VFH99_03075 [Candidatus Saccharimonadales bacterium]|nr:hypothetical protein [Candidatus Saccharimonadales bacterium]